MRDSSTRGYAQNCSCILVPLFALGSICWFPWKNNSNSTIPDSDTDITQARPLGAVPSGATSNEHGLSASDGNSIRSIHGSAASSILGKGPASAGTQAGFYAISQPDVSNASELSVKSSELPPLESLRPGVQASIRERERIDKSGDSKQFNNFAKF